MIGLIHQVMGTVIIAAAIISITACGTARNLQEDIVPVDSLKAQSQPEPTPTGQAQPDSVKPAQPEPTSTGLPTEITEEPVLPASPVQPPQSPVKPALKVAPPVPGSEAALATALADLVRQTGQPADQIKVVSLEAAEWNDTSLGCPKPDMMYAQVITPGFKIILAVQGKEYEYHSDRAGHVTFCPK